MVRAVRNLKPYFLFNMNKVNSQDFILYKLKFSCKHDANI